MPERKRTFVQRLVRWRFLFVVNLMVVVFLSISLGREVVRNQTIQSEIEALETQAENLAIQNLSISELQSALQSESYIEREARLKLGMKKEGESVVVVQEGGEERATSNGGDASDPFDYVIDEDDTFIELANPTKWWYYFFDKNQFENTKENYEQS